MFYDQAILIQWLKEWDGRPARHLLFHQIRAGRSCHSVWIAPKAFRARVPSTCLWR